MAPIERVPIPTETAAPEGETNAYVVGEAGAIVVDPAGHANALDDVLDRAGVGHVLVTHAHPDHVGAVARYADRSDATVWARAGYRDRFVEATGVEPERTFRAGTTLTAGDGTELTVIDTPGHAPDHVALAVDGRVLVGDLAVATGSVVVGRDGGDMRAYLTSRRRLHARNPDALLPAHGPIIERPRPTIARLIAHRLDRERRVLTAVEDGARTLDDVVTAAYDKDVSHVRDLAAETVAAHLRKLDVEGTLSWDGATARPR